MSRQEKRSIVESLKGQFQAAEASFLVNVKGLTVEQMQELRRDLRQEKAQLKVAKNTLFALSAQDVPGAIQLQPYFKEQIAVVFAQGEPIGVARALKQAKKKQPSLDYVAGVLGKELLEKDRIEYFASLPPREQLLAQFCGALKAPIAAHVTVLDQALSRFVRVIKQASEKK